MDSGGRDPGQLVCVNCQTVWYSAAHLTGEGEPCPDCGGPLTDDAGGEGDGERDPVSG